VDVPGWTSRVIAENDDGHMRRYDPIAPLPVGLTLCVYRGVSGPILTGHDSLQVLSAFFSAVTSMSQLEGRGRPYRAVGVDVIDRVGLCRRPGTPWAMRAMCRVQDQEQPAEGRGEWIVVLAARNHFVKVLVSLVPDRASWGAVMDFLEYLGDVLAPYAAEGGLTAPEPTPAEQQQWSLSGAIWERASSHPGEQVFLGPLLSHLEQLAAAPDVDVDALRLLAIRLLDFARFLDDRSASGESDRAAIDAVGFLRTVARSSGLPGDVGNLLQGLRILEQMALAHATPEDVATIRREIAQVEAYRGRAQLH
jgi:hypothetical protein